MIALFTEQPNIGLTDDTDCLMKTKPSLIGSQYENLWRYTFYFIMEMKID